MKLNDAHQPLVYTDIVNILGGSSHVLQNTKALLVSIKEICLEVNADKTKYMVMSRDHDVGRSHSMTIDNSSFERAE